MLFPIPSEDNEETNVVIMPGLLKEAMDMIFESYDYCELQDALDPDYVPAHVQTLISNEMSRITMRLTSVMAWLMARKAVTRGQLSQNEVLKNYRLEGQDMCLDQPLDLMGVLPNYMQDLLERSLKLYERVWRLDRLEHPTQLAFQLA